MRLVHPAARMLRVPLELSPALLLPRLGVRAAEQNAIQFALGLLDDLQQVPLRDELLLVRGESRASVR